MVATTVFPKFRKFRTSYSSGKRLELVQLRSVNFVVEDPWVTGAVLAVSFRQTTWQPGEVPGCIARCVAIGNLETR